MELNERIKACRQHAGLTQEQVAEALDVSRQAVTKWENGKSAPSTEKLFKLAELFGTTVDMLLTDEEKPRYEKNRRRYQNIRMILFTVVWYILIFLVGFAAENFVWVEHKYLILWLLSSGVFPISFAVNIAFILIGWNRVSFSLNVSCLLGLLAGEIFGPNPEGASMGFGHYGWAIWIGVAIAGLVFGLLWEVWQARKSE